MPPLSTHLRSALSELLAASLDGTLPGGTTRRTHGTVRFPGKATAVVGVRRGGKTTFVHQLRRERLATGAPRASVPYINFEDERLAALDASQLGFLVDEYNRLTTGSTRGPTVSWSFDEIQVVPGWERFVRRLLDGGNVEVVVTGSSAALLSREIGTALRGRAWTVPLFPFSFREMLDHHGIAVPAPRARLSATTRAELERAFRQWLTGGGFPEAQSLDGAAHRQLLRDYVDVAMLRDVVERHAVSNVAGLRWLVRHVLGNAGGAFSIEKFHRVLKSQGIAISRDSLHQLLAHIEDCFLVRTVWMEASSERQRMVNPRKVYPVDPALISLFDRTGRPNTGHALETAVMIELERRRCEVTYVRTADGHEVDFLARDSAGRSHLIQVSADARDPETALRELRALQQAGAQHRGAKQWLLALTRDALPADVPRNVTAQAAYEWMLT